MNVPMKPNDTQPHGGGKDTKMEKDINKYMSEFMASHGRRELSEGELDQVVGGAFRKIDNQHAEWDGKIVDRKDFDALILGVYDSFDLLTAINVLKRITGYDATGTSNGIRTILYRFWGD